jgi:glycine C-acetyltransferase/8-amino-7-oxononanoate synthase
VAAADLTDEVDVIMGTLGKALGGYGAYVCADGEIVDWLINSARTFIFSTALPPAAIGAAIAALELLQARPRQVERLDANARVLRQALQQEGLRLGSSETQIVPVMIGDATAAMEVCERALERGVFAQAIRPPTVPEGTSRMRLTVMATHRAGELRKAARVIAAAAREVGVGGAPAEPFELDQGDLEQAA